jgi:hypothetical protein
LSDDGILTCKNTIYIPNLAELRAIIMDEIHKKPYFGHPSYQKMISTTNKKYFWPRKKNDVAEYIARCMECQ